jgi:hypothetical protein
VCDHCGCQELDAIGELTAEHDVVVTLSGQVRRALRDGDLDLAAIGARAIVAVLRLHPAVEEGAWSTSIARSSRRWPSRRTAPRADPFWPRRHEQALVTLREHIIKEQDGVFPAALATLSAAQWDQVDAARARSAAVLR